MDSKSRLVRKLPTRMYTVDIIPRLLPKLTGRLNLPTIVYSWFFFPPVSYLPSSLNIEHLDGYTIKPWRVSLPFKEAYTRHELLILSSPLMYLSFRVLMQ